MSRLMPVGLMTLILALAVSLFASSAKADVTGTFGTHISMIPQSTASEFSLFDIDIENDLNANLLVSGLLGSFHTHFGIAGIEDIIFTLSTALGVLDIESLAVMGRFAFGSITPFYPSLHFIKKKVKVAFILGGVTFSTTSQFEDTAAFVSQTPAYAFGSVLQLAGQTISGISVTAATGLCMQEIPNSIKKHPNLSPYSVNPDCATTPKPDVLFDFEKVLVSGIPLAPNLLGGGSLTCITFGPCQLITQIAFSGGIIPFTTTITFSDLLGLTLGNTVITLFQGPATLSVNLLPTGAIGSINLTIAATLNADTNSADFSISGSVSPGIGLTSAIAKFDIERSGLQVGAAVSFSGGPPAVFQTATFDFGTSLSIVDLRTSTTFGNAGLMIAIIHLIVNF